MWSGSLKVQRCDREEHGESDWWTTPLSQQASEGLKCHLCWRQRLQTDDDCRSRDRNRTGASQEYYEVRYRNA